MGNLRVGSDSVPNCGCPCGIIKDMIWFDAHLDLAYLAVNGRDMFAPLDRDAQPHPPAAVTLASLEEGSVALALATIFTEPGGTGPEGYPVGDGERAYRVGRAQLEVYLTWRDMKRVSLDLRRHLYREPDTGEIRGGMGVAEPKPHSARSIADRLPREPALHLGILIENADPIRAPDELAWWQERGVCAIGMAWAKSSRYAGGNSTRDGLSDQGRALVKEMDRLRLVHDGSHLSDRAFDELCGLSAAPIIASHSNVRALLGDPENQRHLSDHQIREIARRGGVIGLNLFSKFLRNGQGLAPGSESRATIEQTLAHVEHICQLTGGREHVGLGSDMDGGFSAAKLPEGIDRPAQTDLLLKALAAAGWTNNELFSFACGNWIRFWSSVAAGGKPPQAR